MNKKSIVILVIVVLVAVGLAVGGYMWYQNSQGDVYQKAIDESAKIGNPVNAIQNAK